MLTRTEYEKIIAELDREHVYSPIGKSYISHNVKSALAVYTEAPTATDALNLCRDLCRKDHPMDLERHMGPLILMLKQMITEESKKEC